MSETQQAKQDQAEAKAVSSDTAINSADALDELGKDWIEVKFQLLDQRDRTLVANAWARTALKPRPTDPILQALHDPTGQVWEIHPLGAHLLRHPVTERAYLVWVEEEVDVELPRLPTQTIKTLIEYWMNGGDAIDNPMLRTMIAHRMHQKAQLNKP